MISTVKDAICAHAIALFALQIQLKHLLGEFDNYIWDAIMWLARYDQTVS